jgi:hypothetical protein
MTRPLHIYIGDKWRNCPAAIRGAIEVAVIRELTEGEAEQVRRGEALITVMSETLGRPPDAVRALIDVLYNDPLVWFIWMIWNEMYGDRGAGAEGAEKAEAAPREVGPPPDGPRHRAPPHSHAEERVWLDGTANEFARDRPISSSCMTLVHDTPGQVAYYHPGITMEPFGALSPPARRLTWPLAWPWGWPGQHRDAMFTVQSTSRRRIYLFVQLGVHRAGGRRVGQDARHHPEGNEPVPYAIRMLTGIQRAGRDRTGKLRPRAGSLTMSCASPGIQFVGVWDTVSSVGWIDSPLHAPMSQQSDIHRAARRLHRRAPRLLSHPHVAALAGPREAQRPA